jgi:hypothetical protein
MPTISNVSLNISRTGNPRIVTVSYSLTASSDEVAHGPHYEEVISLYGLDLGGETTPIGSEQKLVEISRRWITLGTHPAPVTVPVSTATLAEDPNTLVIRIWVPIPFPGHWENKTITAPNKDEIVAYVVLTPAASQRVSGRSNEVTDQDFG